MTVARAWGWLRENAAALTIVASVVAAIWWGGSEVAAVRAEVVAVRADVERGSEARKALWQQVDRMAELARRLEVAVGRLEERTKGK